MRLALMLLIGWMVGVGQAAEPPKQFSADQVMMMAGKEMTSRLYVDGGNLRTETTMERVGTMVSIVNGEQKVLWMLMPNNMYMEKPLGVEEDLSRKAWMDDEHREHLGRETVNGVECDKYRLTDAKTPTFLFTAVNTGFPVQMVTEDKSLRIEWRNVKPGPQAASLIQLPPGYRKMALPSFPGGLKLPGMK